VVGAVGGTPTAGATGQPVSDRCYEHAGWSGYSGAIRHYKHTVWDGRSTGVATL